MQQGDLIYAVLTGDPTVNGLISNRCTPDELREASALPAIVYRQATAPREHVLTGEFEGLNSPLVEVECWAMNYPAMEQLALAIIALLDGFDQQVGSPPMQLRAVVEDGGDDNVGVFGTRRQFMRPVQVRFFYNS